MGDLEEKYLDGKSGALIGESLKDAKISTKDLTEKKLMIILSAVFGLIGLDRFWLGDKLRGAIKCIIFFGALISIIVIIAEIADQVAAFYAGTVGTIQITWADNVAIVGKPLAYSVFIPIGILVAYIPLVVIDGILCYKKNIKRNYDIIVKQLNKTVNTKN